MGRHGRSGAAAIAVVLALVACSSGQEPEEGDAVTAIEDTPEPEPAAESVDDPAPEPEPAPDLEPEPPEIDITVIPQEITEAYVEAVLVELEQLYVEAYIEYRDADQPTLDVTDRLGSAFSDAQYEARLTQFGDIADSQYDGFRSAADASPRRHEVQAVIDYSETCIYAETLLDLSGVLERSAETEVTFVELGPRDAQRFIDMNPTPWVVHALPLGDVSELRESRPCSD